MKKKTLFQLIDAEVKRQGVRMIKKTSSGGLFTGSTYDTRKVYSVEKMYELNEQGFEVETDLGTLLFNALLKE